MVVGRQRVRPSWRPRPCCGPRPAAGPGRGPVERLRGVQGAPSPPRSRADLQAAHGEREARPGLRAMRSANRLPATTLKIRFKFLPTVFLVAGRLKAHLSPMRGTGDRGFGRAQSCFAACGAFATASSPPACACAHTDGTGSGWISHPPRPRNAWLHPLGRPGRPGLAAANWGGTLAQSPGEGRLRTGAAGRARVMAASVGCRRSQISPSALPSGRSRPAAPCAGSRGGARGDGAAMSG